MTSLWLVNNLTNCIDTFIYGEIQQYNLLSEMSNLHREWCEDELIEEDFPSWFFFGRHVRDYEHDSDYLNYDDYEDFIDRRDWEDPCCQDGQHQ